MALAQELEQLDPVVHRHVDIEDDELVVPAGAHLERTVAIGRGRDLEAIRFQEIRQQLRAGRVVIRDENPAPVAQLATSLWSSPVLAAARARNWRTSNPNVRVSIGLAM